jgi:hypothetical protein
MHQETTMTTNGQGSQQQSQQQSQGEREAQRNDTSQPAAPGDGGAAQRSENLLSPDGADDGRYDVAEEVNLDEQSDAARRVGKAPSGATLDAMGDALGGADAEEDEDSRDSTGGA